MRCCSLCKRKTVSLYHIFLPVMGVYTVSLLNLLNVIGGMA